MNTEGYLITAIISLAGVCATLFALLLKQIKKNEELQVEIRKQVEKRLRQSESIRSTLEEALRDEGRDQT